MVVQFLMALYQATHTACIVQVAHVSLGAPVPNVVTVFGGNCWDALLYAPQFGGLVVPL
jgi:hypothetical protein